MTAIQVCCEKAHYQGEMECPTHNPSKVELRARIAEQSALLDELAGALTEIESIEIGYHQTVCCQIAEEAITKYQSWKEKESK